MGVKGYVSLIQIRMTVVRTDPMLQMQMQMRMRMQMQEGCLKELGRFGGELGLPIFPISHN